MQYAIQDEYIDDVSGLADVSAEIVLEEDDEEDDEQYEIDEQREDNDGHEGEDELILEEDAQTAEVARRIADGGAVARRQTKATSGLSSALWQRIFMAIIVFVLSGLAGQYKLESAPIGFCDTGSRTNDVLAAIQNKRQEIEGCHAQHTGSDNLDACPPLPLVPLPHPDTCTPCPANAVCSRFSVRCDEGYILRPHPLSLIPYASTLVDGMPGFGSVAFPPKCVDDELRKKNIGALGKKIDSTLAEIRGKKLCVGIDETKPIDGGEARIWGFRADELQEILRKKYVREVNICGLLGFDFPLVPC